MQPINYMLDVQSPLQAAMAGYAQGQGLKSQQQGMEMQRELMDMKRMELQQTQQQIAQHQARAQEVQAMMAQFAEQVRMGDVTAEDVIQMQFAVPEMAESIQQAWETLDTAQKDGKIRDYAKLAVALKRNPEVAMQLIDERILAAENAGDIEQRDLMRAIRAQAEMNPEAVLSSALMEMATVMDKDQFKNFMEVAMPSTDAVSVEGKIFQDYNSGRFGDPQSLGAQRVLAQALDRARGPQVQVTVGPDGKQYQYLEQLPDGMVVPKDLLGGYVPGTDRIAVRDSTNPQGFREEIVQGSNTAMAQTQRALNTETVGSVMFEDLNFAMDLLREGRAKTGPFIAGLVGKQREKGAAGLVQGVVRQAFPETVALTQVLDSIRSNVTVQEIQKAREASPTGGLMGNMSERQSDMMGTLLGQLTEDLPDQVLEQNLIRLQNLMLDAVHGTPAQIAELVRQGKVDPDLAQILSYRTPTTYSAAPYGLRQGQQSETSAQNIMQMTPEQLSQLDVTQMNADQLRAYNARIREFGAQ